MVREDTTAVLLKSCADGELDWAIPALPVSAPHLEIEKLFDEELPLVMPPDHQLPTQGVERSAARPLTEAKTMTGPAIRPGRAGSFRWSARGVVATSGSSHDTHAEPDPKNPYASGPVD